MDQSMPLSNPCQRRLADVPLEDRLTDFCQILNRVQRHLKHTPGYCLRKPESGGAAVSRFKFPFPLVTSSQITKTDGKWIFSPKRNDGLLNERNPFISQLWRANTDIQPVMSKQDVVNYVAKYASKAETKSAAFDDTLTNILATSTGVPEDAPTKKIIRKLLISSVAERNHSAQEVWHNLMSYDMYHAGRECVSITIKNDEWASFRVTSEQVRGISLLEKYQSRNPDSTVTVSGKVKRLGDMSLFEMTKT